MSPEHPIAKEFIASLHNLEDTGRVDRLLEIFSEDAEASNMHLDQPARGVSELKKFWIHYRQSFRQVHSEFHRVRSGGNLILLEWASSGFLHTNTPFDYRGVSILEMEGDKIRAFHSYFDSAGILPYATDRHGGDFAHPDVPNNEEPVAPISS